MRLHAIPLCLAAGLALAAWSDVRTQSGPPMSGTAAGPGAPPLQQASGAIGGGSANASAGTPSITGAAGGGRPTIEYSGTGGNVGSPTPPTLPTTGRSRSN